MSDTLPIVTRVVHGQSPDSASDLTMYMMLPSDKWDNPIVSTNPAVTIQESPATDVYVRFFYWHRTSNPRTR
ncbi:hypothetical protein RRG08_021499 [Elysia crispata]|uniref:Uncharacterized protein n=1 Tax=Elysia crispata TaxID=231223 RepID=A0AAE1BDE5_9GAST|nr:hypothetical protein RRG08_021499 [Elysia crispata]